MNAHYVFEEDDPTYCRDYEDEEDERDCWEDEQDPRRDDYVLACDDPRCIMPGPHFLSECYTLEMAEAWDRQFDKTPRLRRKRRRRQ